MKNVIMSWRLWTIVIESEPDTQDASPVATLAYSNGKNNTVYWMDMNIRKDSLSSTNYTEIPTLFWTELGDKYDIPTDATINALLTPIIW